MNHVRRAQQVFDIEVDALRRTRAKLDRSFAAAVDLLVATVRQRGKVIVTGVGKCENLSHKIAATFTSTGTPSIVLDPANALHGDLGLISEGDVVLALSYSGETEELLRILPAIKRFDVRLIALTGHPKSALGRHSDLVLMVQIGREACPFNLAPTASTTAMLALGDALALCVLDARGFRKVDYARLHPAGAIGRTLLLKVQDIMRTGVRNPVIEQSCRVQDALLAMTRAKSGTISVVDRRGRLVGVFTDGDFRRHISRDRAVLDAPVRSVMTPRPVTVRETALAVEALKLFEQRQIDDLIVVDDKRRPVGTVDSQDLPKLKLM